MGQVLRRASGRVTSSKPRPPPPPDMSRNTERCAPPPEGDAVSVQDRLGVSLPEDAPKLKAESNVLEDRDQSYDVMLQKMVGTIKSKSVGKAATGEAFITHKYSRPLPKLRSSKESGGPHRRSPLPPGTLTIAQLQEIMLLHRGRVAAPHEGPLDLQELAKRFGVDADQIEQIVRFVSLPPENQTKEQK